jgi:hypothetical protein
MLRTERTTRARHERDPMRRLLPVLLLVAVIAASAACQATPISNATSGPTPTPGTAAVSPADSASAGAAATDAPTPTPGPTPTPMATPVPTATPIHTATPTPAPTPKPTPAPIVACTAKQVRAQVTGWEGGMGHQTASVTLTNVSAIACKVRGTPEVQLVDAGGAILMDSKAAGASGKPHVSPGDPTFLLAHNAAVTTLVDTDNYCGSATPSLPTTVAFVLPNGLGRLVAAPGPGGGVPPCLGDPGSAGSVAMNGWTR